jgi:uncharacterized membrane protein
VAHSHGSHHTTASRAHRRILAAIAVVIGVVTLVGLVVLWPSRDVRANAGIGPPPDVYGATVTKVTFRCNYSTADAHTTCVRYRFHLDQGPDRGESRTIEFPDSPSTPHLSVGDGVILAKLHGADPRFDYLYSDRQRRSSLLLLAVLFAIVVIAIGRLRGLAALIGLALSIAVILWFMVPSMLDGHSAPLVAIVSATAIAYAVLYITNGVNTMATVALLATLAALALTVVLATLFTDLAHLTGTANEDALLVQLGTSSVNLKGLVLAGMVIGALGVLDDITVTQVSAVSELRDAQPNASFRKIYRAGMRVGRDHVASTVNTLALAYAGAALPLLILFTLAHQSLGTVANSEAVAVEIVATLVGSIGLVVAVPISTWLATLVSAPTTQPAPANRSTRRRSTPAHAQDITTPS